MKKVVTFFLVIMIILTSLLFSSCSINDEVGVFYTLREAYSQGLLTDSDLTQIAEYYHERYSENQQNNLSVNLLGEQTKKQIKNDLIFSFCCLTFLMFCTSFG